MSFLTFTTSNYDAMKKFLEDFGFDVEVEDFFAPIFGAGRAVTVKRDDLEFTLEESVSAGQKASINMWLTDYSNKEVEKIKALGYEGRLDATLHGDFYSFKTPDDGTFIISNPDA